MYQLTPISGCWRFKRWIRPMIAVDIGLPSSIPEEEEKGAPEPLPRMLSVLFTGYAHQAQRLGRIAPSSDHITLSTNVSTK